MPPCAVLASCFPSPALRRSPTRFPSPFTLSFEKGGNCVLLPVRSYQSNSSLLSRQLLQTPVGTWAAGLT